MIVDSHTHLLPGRLGEKVRAFFASYGDALVYPIDHATVRNALAREGIDEIWTLPYAHKPGVAEWLNDSTAAIAAEPGPLSVVGGATVHPGDDDPVAVVRRAVEDHGLRVLKLHCSVGEYDADDERLAGVWAYVAAVRMPVVVHAGHASSGQTEAPELAPIGRVAEHHPEARIVLAHCGYPAVDAALDLVERFENVHADLTPVMTGAPSIPAGRLDAVAGKLLLGTDAPNVCIPAGDRIAAVRALPLDDARIDAILGGTARRLVPP